MNLEKCVLGIELGSTRIKAVLLNENREVDVSGEYEWENKFKSGIWTYDIEDIHTGIKSCYSNLKNNFESKYNKPLNTVGAIGISGMMHGYLPLDKNGNFLSFSRF